MILIVFSLAIYGLALAGPPVCAIAPWARSRPASPWLMGAAGAAITVMYGWAGLVSAAAVSSLWVLVAGAWWVLRRSRQGRRPAVCPVPRREQDRILRAAAERLADNNEIASVVRRWEKVA